MPFASLADFVDALDQAGELARIRVEVDADLEIAAITERVAQQGGPALLFERARGHRPPVATNLLGTESRLCRALGLADLRQAEDLLERLTETTSTWLGKLRAPAPSGEARQPVRSARGAPCQQVLKLGRDVDLGEWPALRCGPQEQTRWITAAQVMVCDPETGRRHVESAPLAVLDKNRLGIVWRPSQPGWRIRERCQADGQPLPVAIWLGGATWLWALAAGSLAGQEDAYTFAASLRGKPLDVVACRTHAMEVPAEADVVLEGHLDASTAAEPSGVLARSNGHYSPSRPCWPLTISAVTHRTNPIFPAFVASRPPNEASVVSRALLRLALPLIRRSVPDVADVEWVSMAGWETVAVVSIKKRHPHQARRVAGALWGLDALMHASCLVLVDEHVAASQAGQVLLALGANVHPARDVFFQDGPAHDWEHASPAVAGGRLMGIDATEKLPAEHAGAWPALLTPDPQTLEKARARWAEYGLGPWGG